MNRTRVAVVGVGSLGQHHARILSGMDDVELVGVVEPREDRGREIASKFSTNWYSAPAAVVDQVDGVVVAVPTVLHAEAASCFLQAGRAVMMEKPIAADLATAKRLQQMAEAGGALLQVGHVERFNPAFELLQEKVQSPLYIRCQRVSPYTFRSTDIGVVHDLMIHDIELVQALVNSPVAAVDSFGAVTMGPHEDFAVARLRFESGAIADLTAGRMCPQAERTIQVWSEGGFVSADLQTRKLNSWQPCPAVAARPGMLHDVVAATASPLTLKDEVFSKWLQQEETQASDTDALTAELRDFVAAVRGETRPRVGGIEGVAAMEVAERILGGMSGWSWQSGSPFEQVRRAA